MKLRFVILNLYYLRYKVNSNPPLPCNKKTHVHQGLNFVQRLLQLYGVIFCNQTSWNRIFQKLRMLYYLTRNNDLSNQDIPRQENFQKIFTQISFENLKSMIFQCLSLIQYLFYPLKNNVLSLTMLIDRLLVSNRCC